MRKANLYPLTLLFALFFISCPTKEEKKIVEIEGKSVFSKWDKMTGGVDKLLTRKPSLEEIEERAGRLVKVKIPYNEFLFSQRTRMMISRIVRAGEIIDTIFYRQVSPFGLYLKGKLKGSKDPVERGIFHLLTINYGVWDRLKGNEPFLGDLPKPPGANFYPPDMEREEFNRWIKDHPEDKESFISPYTVIRRDGGRLRAIPYHEEYGIELNEAAFLIGEAALFCDFPSLRRFLESRAKAFLNSDYYESEVNWVMVKDSPIDVTIGPYEVYEDALFGYKAAFETFITVKDDEESKRLETFIGYLPELEKNLPLEPGTGIGPRGLESPILVANEIYVSGDSRAGVQTTAFNLPNDEKVRRDKGSKKVLLKNIGEAKFENCFLPISKRVLVNEGYKEVSFDSYFTEILMHEISHGLGPGFIRTAEGEEITVNTALKEIYPIIEEAKADIVGLHSIFYLMDKGVLKSRNFSSVCFTMSGGIFRMARFGIQEAHARAAIIEYNYLKEKGAIIYLPEEEKFTVEKKKVRDGIKDLARELLAIEGEGNYLKGEEFVKRYGKMPDEVEKAMEGLKDIPIDIEPVFEIEER